MHPPHLAFAARISIRRAQPLSKTNSIPDTMAAPPEVVKNSGADTTLHSAPSNPASRFPKNAAMNHAAMAVAANSSGASFPNNPSPNGRMKSSPTVFVSRTIRSRPFGTIT